MIDADKLLAETFVRQLEWFDEIGSTNDHVLRQASDLTVMTPYLVGASRQLSGRGRGTNRWWSGEGTLTFSTLFDMLRLGIEQSEWPRFSLVTGLAVAESLEAFLPTASIGLKWPNDVWLSGKKVCGILIEQPERAPGRLVAGLGWNVNTSFHSAPEELRAIATSMREASGREFCPNDVLACFLQRWEHNLTRLASGNLKLDAEWSRFCVLTGREIRVSLGDVERMGICDGIAADGSLLIHEGKSIHRCYAGTVRLI